MLVKVWLWMILSFIGVWIISLPDTGPRIFSFSDAHGPGLVDMIGIIMVLVGYTIFITGLWQEKEKILAYKNTIHFQLSLIIFGFSYGLIVSSVFSSFPLWWVVGIFILVSIHFIAIYIVLKKIKKKS